MSLTARTRSWRLAIISIIMLNNIDEGAPTQRPRAARASHPLPATHSGNVAVCLTFSPCARVTTASLALADPSFSLPAAVHHVQGRFTIEIGLNELADRARDVHPERFSSVVRPRCARLEHVRGLQPKGLARAWGRSDLARYLPGSASG